MNDLTPHAQVTVARLLREPALRAGVLLAGKGGLDRPVTDVAVLDLGELEALHPGQFVLSNAYPLDGVDLSYLCDRFVAAGVSGLGVKLPPMWTAMPRTLVRSADAADLPLLSLPPGRFEDLVNPMLRLIARQQAHLLQTSARLHRSLIEAALRDEGLATIPAIVERALGRPVAIFDQYGGLLAFTGKRELWDSEELARLALEADAAQVVERSSSSYLLAPIATTGRPTSTRRQSGSRVGRRFGTICVGDIHPDDSFARAAIAQAAVVSAMQLVGREQIEAVHVKFEREFLDELIDRRLSASEARTRAARIGWPLRDPYLALVAVRRVRSSREPGASGTISIDDDELTALRRAIAAGVPRVRVVRRRVGLCCVAHIDNADDARETADEIRCRLASARTVAWTPAELAVGVSRPRSEVVELADAFREAVVSVTLPATTEDIRHFDDQGPIRLMAQVEDRVTLRAAAEETLGPLTDPGLAGTEALRETLAALLQHNMRMPSVANELYFHYNTIRHRVKRLHELLPDGLRAPERRVSLWLALTALRVLDTSRLAIDTAVPLAGENERDRRGA